MAKIKPETSEIYQQEINTAEQRYQTALSDAIALYSYNFGVIYRIYCEETNLSYVGQTKEVFTGNTKKSKGLSRIKTHYTALKKGCHPHLKLQAAWNKNSGKSIKHEILEVVPREDSERDWTFKKRLSSAEKHWQQTHKHHEEVTPIRHYAIKKQELEELKEAGIINNTAFVYFALKLKNPWCDRPIRVKPAELAVEWDIPESSVYEAIAKLKSSQLINIDQAEIIIRWQSDSQQASHSDNPECIMENQNQFQDSRINSEIPEYVMENQNKFRDSRINSEVPENKTPESLHSKECKTPHTIHTFQTFKDTTETEGGALKIFEKYEAKLKLYGVHKNIWRDGEIVPNPRMKSILEAIAVISEETAEQNLKAFFEWADRTKGVKDVYAALRAAILKGWRG